MPASTQIPLLTGAACAAVLVLSSCASAPAEEKLSSEGSTPGDGFTTCADVDLSTPPESPATLRLGGAIGAEVYAGWFMMTESPDELRPHAGVWYELENQPFADPAQRVSALQAGQVDGVTSTMPQVITLAESGIDVKVVASMGLTKHDSPADPRYIVPAGSDIKGFGDLEGKTVASIGLGTAAELLARMAIESAGADPDSVEFVNVPPAQHISSVQSGTVDMAIGVQPFLKGALSEGSVRDLGGQGIGLFELEGIKMIEPVNLVFSQAYLESEPEAVCAYLADFSKSLNWLREDLTEARQVFSEKEYIALPYNIYKDSPAYDWPEGDALPPVDYYKALAPYAEKYGFIQDGSAEAVDKLIWTGLGPIEE